MNAQTHIREAARDAATLNVQDAATLNARDAATLNVQDAATLNARGLIQAFLRLPDVFFAALFTIVHPIYKALHMKRAYGRVIGHLEACGFACQDRSIPKSGLTRGYAEPGTAKTNSSNSGKEKARGCAEPGTAKMDVRRITAKDVFRSLYWNGIDSYRLLSRMPSATARVRYENEDIIREALARGPIVALSIHQGAFENLHRSLCRYSGNVHLITSPFKNNALTRALQALRSDPNLHEYSTDQVAAVLRNLFKTRGILAMVVDQAREARGNIVQLFGRETALYLRLPQKANQMGAGIVTFRTYSEFVQNPSGSVRREHIVRFENYYPPHFDEANSVSDLNTPSAGTAVQSTSVTNSTSSRAFPADSAGAKGKSSLVESIAQEIERWIAEHPEQWTWNYHRNFVT